MDFALPKYTFIAGASGVGKTTLAQILFDEVSGLQSYSFADPIRNGVLGIFHEGDISIDLTTESRKLSPLPEFGSTHRAAMNSLGDWFRATYGPDAIGRFARYRAHIDEQYYDRFVFDDARRIEDMEPILSECASRDALLVSLMREGHVATEGFEHDDLVEWCVSRTICPVIHIVNDGTINELAEKLSFTLARTTSHASL